MASKIPAHFLRYRVVDGRQFLGGDGHGDAGLVQFVADQVGAVFEPLFAPGDIDENLLHRASGSLEKMTAIGEVLVAVTGNLQPGLVDESCGLEGLSGFLIGHPHDGQFAQLFINEREQLIGRLRVTMLNGFEDLRDVAHSANPKDQRQNVECLMNAGSSTTNEEAMWRAGIQASDFVIGKSPELLSRYNLSPSRRAPRA